MLRIINQSIRKVKTQTGGILVLRRTHPTRTVMGWAKYTGLLLTQIMVLVIKLFMHVLVMADYGKQPTMA